MADDSLSERTFPLIQSFLDSLPALIPTLVTIAVWVGILWLADWLLLRRGAVRSSARVARQLVMIGLTVVGVGAVIVSLPVGEAMRGQLVGLFGVLVTAVITLSSTTFVSNAMAGFMLRAVGTFHPGDFVSVQDHFGRVTERGLFHTEIQTQSRDLVTLPNLFLVQNPIEVVRHSGTIVSAEVSLGYDVHHARVRDLLVEAAKAAELEEPFARILELGDFSVTYQVAGFLADPLQLLGARSRLRERMLDALHENGVEIVSPNFMNQRALDPAAKVIPRERRPAKDGQQAESERTAEAIAFDKAERAAERADLQLEHESLGRQIAELEQGRSAADEEGRAGIDREIAWRKRRRDDVARRLEADQEREREER